MQEQKDSQCLHVEEYQNLVKDLRMELESVSEQKKNIMKATKNTSVSTSATADAIEV